MTDFARLAEQRIDTFLRLLREWVAIPSAFDANSRSAERPFGQGVSDALAWWQALGDNAGLSTLDVDGHAVHIEYGSGDEIVYVFGHCDVVPAGEGWQHPPYQLTRLGDKLIGRGVVDDKGPMLAAWLALDIIRELKLPLRRRIRLAVGGNEETGFRCIRRYFESQPHPTFAFTPDAKFPVIYGEKGSLLVHITTPVNQPELHVTCGAVVNTIPEKARLSGLSLAASPWQLPAGFTLVTDPSGHYVLHGRGGHSSKPELCHNPIEASALLLDQLYHTDWSAQLREITDAQRGQSGSRFGLDEAGECGKILLVPTVLNIAEGKLSLTLNVRYPENLSATTITQQLEQWNSRWLTSQLTIEPVKSPSLYPPASPLVRMLHDIYVRHTGDTTHPSRTTGAGSYASEMRNAVIFGCEFPDGSSGNTHGADEYGSLCRFISAIGMYAEALYRLANLPAEQTHVLSPDNNEVNIMSTKKLIALCACPMGLAHTFMAAEAIEVEARKRGYDVKVETQGADGIQNELTAADIAEAHVIIHATGVTPQNLERFNGYAVYEVELKDAVKDAGSLIDEIEADQAQ